MSEVTQLLNALAQNDRIAVADELLPLVYEELRRLAAQKLAQEPAGQTLDGTNLVHEAYLRLVGSDRDHPWNGKKHFFAAAAESMRRILIDNARRKRREKRGGDRKRKPLDEAQLADAANDDRLLALHDALDGLAAEDELAAEVVKQRYFVGLTIKETAEVLDKSEATVNRAYRFALAWLKVELE